ncbi:histidine kinase [Paucibacter sp. APW11]|uniref:Histidine kinase n=1 Tax=Roseateles aquae TaxID=3077235 RepID=A0ABU3PH11_9BURK|nr:histidine kinase [Paucibacter sp. APW11]MDT9001662.1 histidine kinase [Paucibacter sp. APW11]
MIEVSMEGLDQQAIFDMIPAAVCVLTVDGGANTVNEAFSRMLGRPRLDLLRQGWVNPFDQASRDTLLEALTRPQDFSCTLQVRPEGGARAADLRYELKGRWSLILRMHVCVLSHKVRSVPPRPLKEAERFRLVANTIPALIAYYSVDGYCCFANRQYARTYGKSEASVVGLHYVEIIGEQAANEIRPILDEGVRYNRAMSYARQRIEPDGGKRWIEVNVLPQLGSDGKACGSFVVVTEISKHRLAPERERARIARELHDGIAQWLVSLQFVVESAVVQVETGSNEALQTLEAAQNQLRNVLREVRRISHDLLPSALDSSGLAAALDQLAREFQRRSQLQLDLRIDDLPRLSREVSTAVYRVGQEALGNIERHARASRVSIVLRHGRQGLTLRVSDDGCGFDAARALRGGQVGLGLASMRERIESLAGRFHVDSVRGRTTVIAILPAFSLQDSDGETGH